MTLKRLLLGLDIGTSGVKGIIINEYGDTVVTATAGYPLFTPKPNWVEQNPDDWWRGTTEVIKKLCSHPGVDAKLIAGIGLSGQMHSLVLLGKDQNVLRNAILWSDTRTDEECRTINQTLSMEFLRATVANPAIEGFTLPKILWVKKHEPEIFEKIHTILLPKDFIRFKLTNEMAMEVSDASGTLLFDVHRRKWSDDVLHRFSLEKSWLPAVYESTDVCGKTSVKASAVTGLPTGIPVVGGGADNTCGAIGTGVIIQGQMLASIGTSGVMFAPMNKPAVEPEMRVHTFCHSIPNRWYMMGVMLMAGGALRWYKDTFCQDEIEHARTCETDVYDAIAENAKSIPPGSEGLYFQPYLAGERTPHRSASARASFIGATMRHTKNHFSRAVFEGITFGMRDSLEIIKGMGIDVRQIRMTGGGAKSRFWRKLQADIYGCEVALVNTTEGPAYGAALLAGAGTGVFGNIEEAVEKNVKVIERIEPESAVSKLYNDYYMIYSKLFPNLRDSYTVIQSTYK